MFFFFFDFCLNTNVDGIFKKVFDDHIIVLDTFGSSYQRINGSLKLTKPEYAIYPWDKNYDWCSKCGSSYDEHPYITFHLKNRLFKFHGYFIRAGCCYTTLCCCQYDKYKCFDCCLYSWSLQISDDNKTWKDVHKIEKDSEMRRCNERTYNLDKSYTAKYVRIIQNDPCPNQPPCIAINRVDFLGEVISDARIDDDNDFVSFHDDDDDVSIIGHISKNRNIEMK